MGKMRSRNKQKGQRTEPATGLKGKPRKTEEMIFKVNIDNWGERKRKSNSVQRRNVGLSCLGSRSGQGARWCWRGISSGGLSVPSISRAVIENARSLQDATQSEEGGKGWGWGHPGENNPQNRSFWTLPAGQLRAWLNFIPRKLGMFGERGC